MPEKPAAEKTEQPTKRKLQKAREQGRVPQSQELVSVTTFMALLLTLALSVSELLRYFMIEVKDCLTSNNTIFADSKTFLSFLNSRMTDWLFIISPILIAPYVATIMANIAVGGLSLSGKAIQLKWSSINPAKVLDSLFNIKSLARLGTSIAKLLFVGLVAWLYLQGTLEKLATLRWAWSFEIIAVIARIIFGLCVRVGIALLAIGLLDAFYQRWQYIQELKMTRQEVKQERKDTEGSPEVKVRIRRIQIQLSIRRLRREVPKASVILVNPTHVAVALRYEAKTMEAPILVAKGADHLAEKIIEIGRSYGVPIVRKPELARTIYSTVEPGKAIPETLYVAVAEILAMIHRLRQRKKS
jgi:flagellar biosynthetic protein FlhB